MLGIEFRYARISESFVAEIGDLVSHGESLVLLGPRNVGKRYLIRRLLDPMAQPAAGLMGLVSFLTSIPDEDDVQSKASVGKGPGFTRLESKPSAVLRWVDQRLGAMEGQVTLCAANVDALPHAEIQEFLSGLRERVEDRGPGEGRLAVVLTGEVDLSQFVSGPLSPFTCANQFVIQGFARAEFLAFAGHYVSLLGPNVKPLNDHMLGQLYDRTGGNTYLLRLVLWSISDHHANTAGATFHPVSMTCLPAEIVLSQPPWNYYLRSITRLIDDDPSCWLDLERLLARGEIPVGSDAPHLLELAGVAVRERGRLTMPETLVRDYIQQRYTPRRFADLYIRQAAWGEAFQRYDRLAPSERCRPSGIEDVADAEEAVKNLSTSLYREATRGPDAVLRLFCDGCRYVMGFTEVTRWRLTDASWEPVREPLREPRQEPTFDQPDPSCVGEYSALLSTISLEAPNGLVTIDPAQQSCLLAIRVPTSHPELHEVIIVGRPSVRNIFSRTREQMSDRLIHDFLAAYSHAWDDQHAVDREQFQKKFTEIASEIVKRLGTEISDMEGALRRAAVLLRTELHYKRICISVIDPKRVTTVPVVLEPDPGPTSPSDLQRHRYRLDDNRPSATLWTIRQRKPCVMPDATTDPRANNEAAAELGIKSVAPIPLLDPQGQVVGTVQVERADGWVPTETEVNALFDFGKKLAVALQLNEQITMLQTALDTLPQPIAIFDRAGRTRYLNKLATHFLEREAKWYLSGTGPRYDELAKPGDDRDWLAIFVPLLEETFADGKHHSDRTDVTIRGRLFHLDAMVKPIWDWRKKFDFPGIQKTDLMAGALFHSQDVSYLSRAFEALGLLITAGARQDDVIDGTIEAIRRLGHGWCRLYVVDPANPSELVSRRCFGSDLDPDVERRFNVGGYRIPRHYDQFRWEGWHCLVEQRPVVFCNDPTRDDRDQVKSKNGLEAVNCKDQKCPPELRKKPGAYWIDFPLVTPDRVFGKLTLEWQPWHSPEDVRTLYDLCKLSSLLVREAVRRENYAQEALHWVLHDIKTPPARLQHTAYGQLLLIDQLRRETAFLPACSGLLKELEDTVVASKKICDEIVDQIEKEKEDLQVFPEIKRIDLAGLIRRMLPIERDRFRVELGTTPAEFVMDLDGKRFTKVLREMFSNAGRFPRESIPVRVTVSVEPFERVGEPWIRVTIADNGMGVSGENKPKIFEESFTTTPSNRNKGWGFGLYKARKLIAEHGGQIDEVGTEGVGAEFVIELPRDQRP